MDLIYLTQTMRWNEEKKQKPVPTSCFIIPYRDVLNMNLRVAYMPDSRPAWRARLKPLEPIALLLALLFPFFIKSDLLDPLPLTPVLLLIIGLLLSSVIHLLKSLFFGSAKGMESFKKFIGMVIVLLII